MDQRKEFVLRAHGCGNFRELCREFGISAKTGYKWYQRFLENGLSGLAEASRRPRSHPKELGEEVVCEIVRLKNAHRHWGPRKIRELYRRKHGKNELPSESSFKRVLQRAGLTTPRRVRRARDGGRLFTGRKAAAPNEVWTVDFKGWWRGCRGERVEPLTVRDEYSRMVLEVRALESAGQDRVRPCFERLFERHGLPGAIRSDNGPPFACWRGLLGLTRLSAWWVALGIDLERGRPGCPQDNGAHERLHLDIRRELQAGRMGRDQAAFDTWRHEFNHERPHEALGMCSPAEKYANSPRKYQGSPHELDYGAMETRRLDRRNGMLSYGGQRIGISMSLVEWNLGLAPRPDGLIEVWFSRLLIGHLESETASFLPAPGGREDREEAGEAKEKVKP